MPLRIVFAVQATYETGAGHLMRCLQYAESLANKGLNVGFYGLVNIPWLQHDLDQHSYDLEPSTDNVDLLIIDSYDIAFINESLHSFRALKSIQFCDRSTPMIPNVGLVWLDVEKPPARLPLNSYLLAVGLPFFAIKDFGSVEVPSAARNILVTFGGSPENTIYRNFIRELEQFEGRGYIFHVLTPFLEKKFDRGSFIFYPVGKRLRDLAGICDTVICGAGTSIWDFIANRRVVGTIPLVENQLGNFKFAVLNRLALNLQRESGVLEFEMMALERLLEDSFVRQTVLGNSVSRPDFEGVQRFSNLILEILP